MTTVTATALISVRCRGCRRQIGVCSTEVLRSIFCSPECALDIPATENEARDSVIELLAALGTPRPVIGEEFGLTKQRVHQILSKRAER